MKTAPAIVFSFTFAFLIHASAVTVFYTRSTLKSRGPLALRGTPNDPAALPRTLDARSPTRNYQDGSIVSLTRRGVKGTKRKAQESTLRLEERIREFKLDSPAGGSSLPQGPGTSPQEQIPPSKEQNLSPEDQTSSSRKRRLSSERHSREQERQVGGSAEPRRNTRRRRVGTMPEEPPSPEGGIKRESGELLHSAAEKWRGGTLWRNALFSKSFAEQYNVLVTPDQGDIFERQLDAANDVVQEYFETIPLRSAFDKKKRRLESFFPAENGLFETILKKDERKALSLMRRRRREDDYKLMDAFVNHILSLRPQSNTPSAGSQGSLKKSASAESVNTPSGGSEGSLGKTASLKSEESG